MAGDTKVLDQHHAGRSVAAARKLRGQSQEDLARLLGEETGEHWTRMMVAKMEGGSKRIDADTLRALIAVQGFDADFYLFGPTGMAGIIEESGPLHELLAGAAA